MKMIDTKTKFKDFSSSHFWNRAVAPSAGCLKQKEVTKINKEENNYFLYCLAQWANGRDYFEEFHFISFHITIWMYCIFYVYS